MGAPEGADTRESYPVGDRTFPVGSDICAFVVRRRQKSAGRESSRGSRHMREFSMRRQDFSKIGNSDADALKYVGARH